MATERLEDTTSAQADIRAAAAALVARTCGAQGLPEKVADPGALGRIAALIAPQPAVAPARRRPGRRMTNKKAGTVSQTPVPANAGGSHDAPSAV